ncbi:hypothetical protein DNH61_06455 [Paenibacillus sambharensis]|uniref:Xylose isomerase-like TIM barrel domain-containing protein n=1 Tax=Paenibacillus sambharensis TaxID=1803190 RepID=A0A2W1LPQ2_9BACL|nr:sugar phosphate isomerase/epimerase [Paenibacillus sambharensis]PZD96835.1 hypothetical protein DNH61_06455 [Paenibacillus sambharensis]
MTDSRIKRACHLAPWGRQHLQGLTAVSEAGFRFCEAGSQLLLAYADRLPLLKEQLAYCQIKLSAVYELGHFENWARRRELYLYHQKLARTLSIMDTGLVILSPGFSFTQRWSIDAASRMLELIGEMARRYRHEGISVGIHPHLGSLFFTEQQIDYFMERLPAGIGLAPDFGHLAEAQIDIPAFLRKYGCKIRSIHLKDAVYVNANRSAEARSTPRRIRKTRFCWPGKGELDLNAAIEALSEIGYQEWLTVELEPFGERLQEGALEASRYLECRVP